MLNNDLHDDQEDDKNFERDKSLNKDNNRSKCLLNSHLNNKTELYRIRIPLIPLIPLILHHKNNNKVAKTRIRLTKKLIRLLRSKMSKFQFKDKTQTGYQMNPI